MKCLTPILCSFALLLFGCAHRGAMADAQNLVAEEFVGTSPGGAPAREFLGGLASDAPCHSITWQIALLTNRNTGLPTNFSLTALYRVPTRSNTNRSEDGPNVALHGTWSIIKGTTFKLEGAVYRLTADQPKRSLSFVKVGDYLLHLLNPDGGLTIGNAGWSYTLNRADHSEKPGDLSQVSNAPEISYKISALSTGATVFGVFEGRTPCHGIAGELKAPQHAGCIKSKWRLTLFQNPATLAPTTYKVEGSLFRERAREALGA